MRCWSCFLFKQTPGTHGSLCLRKDDERVKTSWVRIKDQTSQGDTVVCVFYRTPDQEQQGDEIFYRQLEGASQSQTLVPMCDFNHPHLWWRNNTAEHTWCTRLLHSTDDNFLTRVVKRLVRKDVLLDLVLTTKNWLGCECWGQLWLQQP